MWCEFTEITFALLFLPYLVDLPWKERISPPFNPLRPWIKLLYWVVSCFHECARISTFFALPFPRHVPRRPVPFSCLPFPPAIRPRENRGGTFPAKGHRCRAIHSLESLIPRRKKRISRISFRYLSAFEVESVNSSKWIEGRVCQVQKTLFKRTIPFLRDFTWKGSFNAATTGLVRNNFFQSFYIDVL